MTADVPKAPPQDCYLVEGGHPLTGTLVPSGSKNAALPILAATLLTESEVVLHNVPRIRDVDAMLLLLESAGVEIVRDPVSGSVEQGPRTLRLRAGDVRPDRLDLALCKAIRASILLAGPMLARFDRLTLPPPGGDVIGRRRLDTHFLALERMGAEIALEDGQSGNYRFRCDRLEGACFQLDEPSVTGTENALMAATVAWGDTVIYNAACEPNVQDLAAMLSSMGARIEGAGTNRITVHGTGGKLLGGCEHRIAPDHIEIGSFIGLAACCGGEVRITDVPESVLGPIMSGRGLSTFGIDVRRTGPGDGDIVVPAGLDLQVRSDRGGAIPEVYDHPWPGFSPDLTSTAVVVATQSGGTCLVHEKMFEARLFFVDKLVAMGARIVLCDPHRVVISGPSRLTGTEVTSPDIRAGMALLTAALCAGGTSLIRNVHQIERGYESLVQRLSALGARVTAGPSLPIS
ncbi:UDP-N-acetylglucosamine 1-carboxyvinyltransferase [Candidatus Fermentibacterales bacterium]|nr:UDP-N-acetylglucosamine 1-carboxyvinyltransferase [Candidatus Fermentibacterales bacterium]